MTKIFTIFLLITICSCGQAPVKQKTTMTKPTLVPSWKKLDEANYSIQYPPDWELNKSGQMGTSFFILAPLESNQDKFKENVNLLIQNLAGMNIDLDKYVEISENQLKTMITNSTLIESKRIKNEGNEYHRMIYTGDQGIFHLQFEQYFWVTDKKAYVLTLSCEQNKYAGYKKTGESILNSFTLNL